MPYAYNKQTAIYYEVEGEGPPLLLHHGLSDSLHGWRSTGWAGALNRDYRLILIDARGHGSSDKPRRPAAYTLAKRVNDVIAVLDDLAIRRVHYLGFSLGGWVGFGLARFAPERLRSLVLLGAHPFAESMSAYRRLLRPGLVSWVSTLDQLSGGLPAVMKRRMRHENDLPALLASVANDRPDISDSLPTTMVPTLLCVGCADARYQGVRRSAAILPRARLHTVRAFNHFQIYLRPEATLPSVDAHLREVERDDPFVRLFSSPL